MQQANEMMPAKPGSAVALSPCCSPGWLCGTLDVFDAASNLIINTLIKALNFPNVTSLEDLFYF
jgi:hypothetical protein